MKLYNVILLMVSATLALADSSCSGRIFFEPACCNQIGPVFTNCQDRPSASHQSPSDFAADCKENDLVAACCPTRLGTSAPHACVDAVSGLHPADGWVREDSDNLSDASDGREGEDSGHSSDNGADRDDEDSGHSPKNGGDRDGEESGHSPDNSNHRDGKDPGHSSNNADGGHSSSSARPSASGVKEDTPKETKGPIIHPA